MAARTARLLSFSVVLLIVAIATVGSPVPVHAHHIAGAAYGGTTSGGGSVSFLVSADGQSLTNLHVTTPTVQGDHCTYDWKMLDSPSIPITNHAFTFTVDTIQPFNGFNIANHDIITGTFPANGVAQGTLTHKATNTPSGIDCTGNLSWTARLLPPVTLTLTQSLPFGQTPAGAYLPPTNADQYYYFVFRVGGVNLTGLPITSTTVTPSAGWAYWGRFSTDSNLMYVALTSSATPGGHTVTITVPDGRTASAAFTVPVSPPPAAPLHYLALGDSVPDGEDLGGCPTGTNCKGKAYPQAMLLHLQSAAPAGHAVDLHNLACSGFTTQQFMTAPSCHGVLYDGGSQLAAATGSGTQSAVITLTLGADNLLTLLQSHFECLTRIPVDPAQCDSVRQTALSQVRSNLETILPRLSTHAHAVVVTGYYHLFPQPFPGHSGTIYQTLNDDIDLLNDAISSAAVSVTSQQGLNNVFYQSLVQAFIGHEFGSSDTWLVKRVDCQGYADITQFHNAAELTLELAKLKLENKLNQQTIGCLFLPAVHPSEFGQTQIASTIWTAIGPILSHALQ